MLKYLGTITQPSGETCVLEWVECSFVLKTTSTAGRYGRMENIPAMKDCNGRSIIDPIEKANSFNY